MFRLGLPIPRGFIISSEASSDFFKHGAKELSKELTEEINKAVREIELETGKYFGMQPLDSFPKKTDRPVPLLLSVRADSSVTVPGIMPSILNLGLNDSIVGTMFKSSNNGRWVYDTYRRFLQSFGTIVFDVPAERYEAALNALLERKGMKSESYLGVAELVELVSIYKGIHPVPEDPWLQLGMAIAKVMRSWWSDRAVNYRDIHNIAEDVSVNIVIQSMVYGNRNVFSGSGIAYSRNPVTGEQGICGDYLPNSEGDDVLSGMRTPMPLMDLFREQPVLFEKLANICSILEKHFQDVQVRSVDSFIFIRESLMTKVSL
jgi:pyruvate,orthophosphate dikinase